jgi:hypothetical protein
MSTTLDVVGATPISITGSTGGQRIVPLSALQFSGSAVRVKQSWASTFTTAETTALVAVATARVASGELRKPPVPLPTPALVVTAAVPGPESNGIAVHVTPNTTDTTPASTPIAISVTELDTYADLATAEAAAAAIGTDKAPTTPADPPLGSGLGRVKSGSVATGSKKLPVDLAEVALTAAGLDVKDSDGNILFTLLPRPGYNAATGLTVQVRQDASGTSFTVSAAYDSAKETATLPAITIQSLDPLPPPVAYLVTVTAPAAGAAVPAPTPAEGVTLTGGGPGLAARALLYTPTA